jgi:Mg-chelatase subunit ChlD
VKIRLIRPRLHILVLILILLAQILPQTSAAAQSSANEHLAIIQILDDSGSMETSDPTDLRYTGAQLFVSLLDEGDAVGALRFSTTSSPITNGIEIITNSEQHTRLVERLAAVSPDGFTDVKAAFEEARRMQQAFNQAGYRVVVVFLTDGKPEIPKPYSAYEQEALDAARSLGVPVLSIALTSGAQSPFLNRLASETGGRVILANSAADLLDSYLQILGELKDRTVIGVGSTSAPGQAVLPLDPALMPYVDRVSFVVSKPASATASLVAPDGQVVAIGDPTISFAIQDRRFVVYTLPHPTSGDWQIALSGSGTVQARAILYSRLRVNLVSPQGAFEASQPLPLVVKLVEAQPGQAPVTIIGEASFAAWITRPDGAQDSLDQFYDDGTHGDALAGDGLYTRLYVNTTQPGTYSLAIRGSKGAVPVAYQAQIYGVAFPLPVLDQPLLPRYDIRADTVPLQLHLAGAAVNELDQGDFVAVVTTPGGVSVMVPLTSASGVYSGAYLPTENGVYQVRFAPVDAAFQGLPYQHSLETAFEARIIPTLAVKSTQVGLTPPANGEMPRFELVQAQQGIPLIVGFSSTASQAENITARLEEMPGFTLLETGNLVVAANADTTLTLHLAVDPTLPPQTYAGRLVFTGREGIDLVGGDILLALALIEPTLSVTPVITSVVSSDSCLAWAPVRLTLYLSSTSTQDEQIQVRLENLPGASLSQQSVTVLPGASQLELTILPDSLTFAPGSYTGKIVVEGVRPGLKLTGDSSFQVAFRVEPLWITCRKPMIFSGAALVFTVILFASMIARAKRKARPPVVTGTLIHWDKDAPDLTADVNLTAINKTEVKIGKGSQNDIVIPDEAMQDEHALILVERDENDELRFTLRPLGPVRKGYREYKAPTAHDLALEENVQYQMGSRMFKYIRDLDL